jgi:putative ABC transport system permease protein
LDENISQLYEQENRLNSLLIYFNFIAVLLGSLGIIGLTIFLTNIKIKEIGIRKILGATPISVATLSIKEYIPLVLIALGISFPIVYILINKWLEEFAYKFDIQYITIIPIGLGILLIIGFLVGTITLKAANRNPVETLRSE